MLPTTEIGGQEITRLIIGGNPICGVSHFSAQLDEDMKNFFTMAEVKKLYGKKMCLMGNLNTTDIMLRGSTADVEKAAKKAIDDAGKDGGFLLSTGDQCGRDTPDENIFTLVKIAKTYGKY